MAEVQPPGFLDGPPVSTDAATFREQTKILAGGLQGVCALGDFAVSQSGTPGMSVDVAAGRAIVNATTVNGAFTVRNDAAITNLPIAAADPSNPRIDRVIVEVRPGSPNDDWRVRVVAGTPASSPSAPATPDNSLSLATVAVAALASSITNANITSTRTFAGDYGLDARKIEQSTGTITPSGITAASGLVAKVGTLVVLSLTVQNNKGSSLASPDALGTISSGFRPGVSQAACLGINISVAPATVVTFDISTAGAITFRSGTVTNTSYMNLHAAYVT